jgi:hypothetical protein
MSLDQAIAVVKAAGYRVTKPRQYTVAQRVHGKHLNAIGKPYGANYDRSYRMRYRPTLAHLSKPYSDAFRAHLTK